MKTNKEDKWRFSVDMSKIDPNFITLLLSYEDKRFYSHYGIDPLAMFRAVSQWIMHGRIVSGASTITMQLAKLLHPRPRTFSSKLIEMFRAIQLEQKYSKDQILEFYLTLAPYGGNIEGIMAGSMRYFNKYPYRLLASQMALLVSLPQSPERNRPDRHPLQSKKARDKILNYALEQKIITKYEHQQAIHSTVPKTLYKLPRYNGHIAEKHLNKTKDQQEIKTTINKKLQIPLEKWAFTQGLDKDSTFSVLVVRNKDASIQAYLGSHNRFSQKVSGYIDMVKAIRSPASTLKPFIYTEGFEKYLIHPHTIINDEETRFGDYTPHNFSGEYKGEVSISYALTHSLNIPAVKVFERIGIDDFVSRIDSFVSKNIFIPKNKATLPIALGGLGLSLWQLTELYVALANEGRSKTLHYLKSAKSQKLKILYTKASSKMTTAILRRIKPPKGFHDFRQNIAYKTGTSYGYRDAWTIAYTKEHTVGIWVGKPNNQTQNKCTGMNTAAPLAFEVLSMIESLLSPSHWQWSPYYIGNTPPIGPPIGLAYFDKERKKLNKDLAFVSPQENQRFMSAGCSDAIVEVAIKEGKAPYYWFVDDEVKEEKQKSMNIPLKHGGHTLQVIDSLGAIISRNIWVNKPEC